MSTQADLKWIQKELEELDDPTLIEVFKNMLKSRKKATSKRIDIHQYNKELDTSIAQIKTGKTYTHQQMGERIKKWSEQ
jgi:hypothetical protein